MQNAGINIVRGLSSGLAGEVILQELLPERGVLVQNHPEILVKFAQVLPEESPLGQAVSKSVNSLPIDLHQMRADHQFISTLLLQKLSPLQ